MQKVTEGFPSYWTLIREQLDGKTFVPVAAKQGSYKIICSPVEYPAKQNKGGSKLLPSKKDVE